jgi:hypothetical protein
MLKKCQHFWTDSSPVVAVAARRPAAGSGGGDAGLLRRMEGATEARGGRMGTREGGGRRERGVRLGLAVVSKGCWWLHESKTLEVHLPKFLRKIYRISGK